MRLLVEPELDGPTGVWLDDGEPVWLLHPAEPADTLTAGVAAGLVHYAIDDDPDLHELGRCVRVALDAWIAECPVVPSPRRSPAAWVRGLH